MADASSVASAFGYLTQAEVKFLRRLASHCPENAIIVNVGAGAGTSALAMAEGKVSAAITSIDISPGGPFGGLEGERNAFNDANFHPLPYQVLMDSREAARQWPTDESHEIDLIFIDDGHLEAEIRGDINGWMFHVKHGGMVAFHDYGAKRWPDVKKVIDELLTLNLSKFDKIDLVDTVIAFRKK